MTKISMKDSGNPGSVKEQYSYEYDNKGQIIKESLLNNYPNSQERINEERNYTYDFLDRLTNEVITSNGNITEKSYTYDRIGNRLTETTNGETVISKYDKYGYNWLVEKRDGSDSLLVSIDYDEHGNQTEELDKVTDEKTVSTYDSQNRLETTKVTNSSAQEISRTENLYNGDGQRVKKVVHEGTNTAVDNYYYQNGVVAYTTDEVDNKKSHNIIGDSGNILSTKRYDDNKFYSYNKDVRGSVMTILDDVGAFVTGYKYTDFGETTKFGDTEFYNEVCYTGGIYDESTELYYLNARYYDPANSRFLSMDTYRGDQLEPQSLHLYSYCHNNPINFTDPTGHWAKNIHRKITKKMLSKFKSKKNIAKLKVISGFKKRIKNASDDPDDKDKFNDRKFHGKAPGLYDVKSTYLDNAVIFYKNGRYIDSAKNLGVVLHTYQDYYAHNVVDNGKTIYYRTYYMKYWGAKTTKMRRKLHETYFDGVTKVYSGSKDIWNNTTYGKNPRIKKTKKATKKILKEFLRRV